MSKFGHQRYKVGKTYLFLRNHYVMGENLEKDVYYYGFMDAEMICSQIITVTCVKEELVEITSGLETGQVCGYQFEDASGNTFNCQYPEAFYSHNSTIGDFVIYGNGEIEGYLLVSTVMDKIVQSLKETSELSLLQKRVLNNIMTFIQECEKPIDIEKQKIVDILAA